MGCSLSEKEILTTSENWSYNTLQGFKTKLNSVKSELNEFELYEWHQHTTAMNPVCIYKSCFVFCQHFHNYTLSFQSGSVIATVKRQIHPELCTQAWCKFYEILSKFPQLALINSEARVFKSLHLCEAPGAFVTSLNHFLTLNQTGLKINHNRKTFADEA